LNNNKAYKKILIAPLCALFSLPAYFSTAASRDDTTSNAVKVSTITHAPIRYHVRTFGLLAPNVEDLSFQIPGRIETFLVDEGDVVEAGQLLVMLETKDARDQLSKMKVALDQADRRLTRFKKLFKDRSIQKSQLEDAQDEYEKVHIAYQQAELNLDRCRLVAPGDGVILREFIDSRTTVTPGLPIFSFQNSEEIWLTKVELTDKNAFTLKKGNRAELKFSPYPGITFNGEVSKLARIANTNNGLFTAEVSIQTGGYPLKPGMIAEVDIFHQSKERYSTVPLESMVRMRNNTATIYLLAAQQNKVLEKQITIKAIKGNQVAVLESLQAFDRVVVRGQARLQQGTRIHVIGETK